MPKKKASTPAIGDDKAQNDTPSFVAEQEKQSDPMGEIYKEYNASSGDTDNSYFNEESISDLPTAPPADDSGEETPAPAAEKAEEASEEETAPPADDTGEEVTAPAAEKAEEEQEDVGEFKTVPLSAVVKERQKRQELEAKIALMEEQAKLKETKTPQATDEYEYEEADPRVKALEKKLAAIEQSQQTTQQERQRAAIDAAQADLGKRVDATAKELAGEGFKGFKFCVGAVTQELRKLVAQDEAYAEYDNPAGWKKIYKEKIYPELKNAFMQEKLEEKQAAKKDLGLIDNPGTSNKPKPKETPKTEAEFHSEYAKERKTSQLF